ncbi:hypothetical protein MTP99_007805 [Tenebrio molitor]|jgi:hypothetical protein|uniref:EEF1A lysine methyltransferase 1 n=1 Tax=Tenebrio molitor TaxID=7067 RepID=UPI00270605E1|nr:hypothetical protein MTP99_007805 [Tenebrio molitor]
MSNEEDDVPQLSASTFLALQEFYKEREEKEKRFVSSPNENVQLDEDWQLSQFWYDDKTIEEIVNIAVEAVGPDGKVALISCPSLYKKLKNKMSNEGTVTLYEYDRRFAVYGEDFVHFDYKLALSVPRDKANYYDLVIADPPFLSEECLTKTAVTIKFLTKFRVMLCTGAVMQQLVERLLDLKQTSFKPQHKNNLANEFSCYTNFSFQHEIQ